MKQMAPKNLTVVKTATEKRKILGKLFGFDNSEEITSLKERVAVLEKEMGIKNV
jgi:hypothetical protein